MNIQSKADLEKALSAMLRELLSGVQWLHDWRVSQNPAPADRAFDIHATIPIPHRDTVELWVECQTQPRPSRIPSVNLNNRFHGNGKRTVRVPVLAASYISDRLAEVCESHGWGWFDLAGNCRLSVPGAFLIERRGNPPVHQPPKPTANLGTAESARVIRALLVAQNIGKRWSQRELQNHCQPGVSLGLVNKVVLYLREQAFLADDRNGGFRVQDYLGLLTAWRAAYRFDRQVRRGYFTLKTGRQLTERLQSLGAITGTHAAYASFSAAEFQAPHVRQPKTWLFVASEYEEAFAEATEAKPVDSGENLVVLIPEDTGVFYQQEVVGDRLACTNPIQTYVDLLHSGGRGQEAAAALLEQNLKPAWKAKGVS
ncbi:MAG: hypothetical protein BGO12_17220 [Verrucomicrobia bacterium 61-8]|nr:hypothetical protein [Verrucomicrobiota bacterium]OJV12066.1 MAG: hypothetical protein BGO12_17220 [Verrucomicrobia bacterium 61-8]